MSFVHLHCHSEYSLLDGANRLEDLVRRAVELEQPALAVTDHGNLHAAWAFQELAKRHNLKPIIGMEAYVAPGDRRARSRPRPDAKPYFHLVLLARDAAGYRNLIKLSSLAYTEGFYAKPRMDRELLARYSEGLIVSSACMAGEIATQLLADDLSAARETAAWYAETFRDRYYLEVQAHAAGEQRALNEKVFSLATELGLPVVATNDSHFLRREDHDAHDVLLCIGLGKDRSDQDRMHYDEGLYFKSSQEISAHFPDRPDVLENTLRIADESGVEFAKKYFLPSFPLPEGVETENELLVRLATEGALERYASTGGALPADAADRLKYELDVITRTGYAGYFLIVYDFIKAARDRGIPVGPGRGSAAGSLVAYALRITDVCPLKFDLLFERFLNPERVSMPDIDVDFCFERRGEVIEYVRQKYGRDSVGQIITFGTLKSRAAIKDVGRTLGFTPAETDALAKLIPNQPNYSLTVKEAIERVPEVGRLYDGDERYRQLLDYAMKLEGLSRHAGVHAAGVVIAPGPLDEYVPVCTAPTRGAGSTTGEEDTIVVTQYDMTALEKVGMLKMDFLGLTTLTVLHDTIESIRARTGSAPDLSALTLDDPATYRMLRSGRTVGVFQFESPLATDTLRSMHCDRFDDLVAANALLRPGPLDAGMHRVYFRRKRGDEPVSYALPELEEVLKPTYGVITYQEQVMRIAQLLAGMSLAEADVLRKAVGKKDAELIKVELGKFTSRSVERGYAPRIIEEIAGQIETFGRYGFNKSHSVAYSILAYQTAWLKTHHTADFMAALLSSQIGDTDSVVKYIAEAREMGIEILPPDVNESGYKFTVVGDKRIRFGLGGIRNAGRTAIESILIARAERPFESLFDFCGRIDLRICNRRVLEALANAGALDALGGHRAQVVAGLDVAMREASLQQEEAVTGQASLFGGPQESGDGPAHPPPVLPNVPAWTEAERLTREKEILGFYISGHPLEPFRVECELFATNQVADLGPWRAEPMVLCAVITGIKRQLSKQTGTEFARLTIEDFSGSGEALVFAERWAGLGPTVTTDVPVLIRGGYMRRDQTAENPVFVIESVTGLSDLRADGQVLLAIDVGGPVGAAAYLLDDVRAVLEEHPGGAPVEFRYEDTGGAPARFRSRRYSVSIDTTVLNALRALLGEGRVHLERAAANGAVKAAADGGRGFRASPARQSYPLPAGVGG
ncbi:MAG TPA: DNA polymerase III subunit alpha [Gemmatimonadaceae bacterium]|nr:DNA polymerase III subunit alpha [Gemmatimonadaceae bacterium]